MGIKETDLLKAGIELYNDPDSGELKLRKRKAPESNGASSPDSGATAEDLKLRILKARAREGEAKATKRERDLSAELEQAEAEATDPIRFFAPIFIGGVSLMMLLLGGSILLLIAVVFVGILGSLIGIW